MEARCVGRKVENREREVLKESESVSRGKWATVLRVAEVKREDSLALITWKLSLLGAM